MKIAVLFCAFIFSIQLFAQKADTVIFLNHRKVVLKCTVDSSIGTILCLPGWNFSATDVCEKSSFCARALSRGYTLILPDMQKSIYATRLNSNTRSDWKPYPQLSFITDTLIPFFRINFNLLYHDNNNYLYGISTGGRGVAMIAMHTGILFKAGVALSGDFIPEKMKDDKLLTGYFGNYNSATEYWNENSPYVNYSKIQIPLLLIHGTNDNVVSYLQSEYFYELMKENNKEVYFIKDNYGHDYGFWNYYTKDVLDFFGKH